ncbi:MAG: hypothetical protein K0R29_1188 [Pseudobdellovibrio sp.]|nr:hypothetical protein [Pseudobdellovibrio sp.]
MKAVKAYKEHWEEINLLRLIYAAKLINEKINILFKAGLIVFNLALYISYRAAKGLWLIVHLLLFTEPRIMQVEKDETWIFRQLK